MADEKDHIKEILESEKTSAGIDDSIFMGQMDLMKEVEAVDDSLFPGELLEDLMGGKALTAEEKGSFFNMVKNMSVAEKVKLALLGNKEARDILIREQNKMILRALMKNPRIQVSEVSNMASSKSVNDEVLRLISQNREWMRTYSIKKDLVFNPRTPQPLAIKLYRVLRENDIKTLSKSKDVSSTISRLAKRHIQELEKKRKKARDGGGH